MGTKLEYAVNLLATSPNSNSFTVHCVDDWEHFQNRGLKGNLEDSMDRNLEKHNIESIKKTMQMHEDVFKNQVKELHRLYSVQKLLMNEVKKEVKQNRCWNSMTNLDINHSQFINPHHPTIQSASGYNFHLQSLRDDPTSRERSGSCSGDSMRMPRGFDLERPAEEDISTGVITAIDEDQAGPSSSIMATRSHKMSIDGSDEDSGVELTLSIGGSLSKKASKSSQLGFRESSHKGIREIDSSASFKSERGEDCSDPTTPMSSSSATFHQETNRPHWLFQGLKLK
uniref:Uncharacterized protein n=1 Tax=Fagus sylvatica TaxID=28930 RepID=A0A2N9I1M0_FAGSY